MRNTIKHFFACIIFSSLFSTGVIAGEGHSHFSGDPISTMAKIVSGLNHHADKEEKEQLKDIIAHNKDNNIKIVATALANLNHSATDKDKSNLEKVINDGSASAEIKTIAKIIHDINHKPSSADKQALSALIK